VKINQLIANLNDYLLLFLALLIIFGAGVYYIYALNWGGIIIILFLTLSSFYWLTKYLFPKPKNVKNYLTLNKKEIIWFLLYLLFFGLAIYILEISKTGLALISPWQVVSWRFFFLYLLASLILILVLIKKTVSPTEKIILISLHYFLSLSVAIIVYKIGYGFDPFIHQATMELIDKKGLVTPKPPYYLGEYGLIIVLHKLSGLSLYFLNKILVPALTAIFLPLNFYRFLKNINPDGETAETKPGAAKFLSVLFLLALVFSPFIVTTPQNLTYLFLILTIFTGLSGDRQFLTWLLALSVLAIHPLTGLPALIWSLFLIFSKHQNNFKRLTRKIIKISFFVGGALALPLALFITAGKKLKNFTLNAAYLIEPFKNIFQIPSGAGQENWLLNFIYFLGNNYNFLLIVVIIATLIYFYRQKDRPDWSSLLLINSSLVIAYVFVSQIVFVDLINYEQTNYAGRLLVIMVLFFLPYLVLALNHLIRKILAAEMFVRITWLIFGLALIGASLYLSYPRFDKYFNSRGYSVGLNDLLTVKKIAAESEQPYIALANQQVSVAALKELGFNHYYQSTQGPIYFYPIPTGGPLYQYYLQMVYQKPSRLAMLQALDLAGVNEGYLIINKYWHESGKIINEAKLTADDWSAVNNDVYIFKYRR
jgi:hypothetical protein